MSDQAQILRMVSFLNMRALEHKIQNRLDRCCHGGPVGYRLPLAYRIEAANGTLECQQAQTNMQGR